MDIYKISKFEAICLVCIVIANHIIINIPETIIQSAGSSAWVNVIFITIIAIGFSWIIYKLFNKFSGKDILDISEYVGNRFFKTIIGIAYIVLFTIISSTLIRYFCTRFENNIFSKYSYLYINFDFLALCIYC